MNKPHPLDTFIHGLGVMSVVSTVILFFAAFSDPERALEPVADGTSKQMESVDSLPRDQRDSARTVPVTRALPKRVSEPLRT